MKHSFVMTYMLVIPYIIGYILSFVVDIIGTYIILPKKEPEICRLTKAVAEPPEDDDEDMAVFVGAQSCWLMLWNIN